MCGVSTLLVPVLSMCSSLLMLPLVLLSEEAVVRFFMAFIDIIRNEVIKIHDTTMH